MYCHNCGTKAVGKYCIQCGTAIIENPAAGAEPETGTTPWREETDLYQLIQLIQREKVRAFIEKYAAQARVRMSSGQFLELFDNFTAFAPIPGISTKKLSEILVPLAQRWNIGTGKTQTHLINKPLPEALIACLCTLAQNGYALHNAEHAGNGLVLHAQLPSDMWTWGGDILIALEAAERQTSVSIAVNVRGQLYDWGKSKAVIKRIYTDMEAIEVTLD